MVRDSRQRSSSLFLTTHITGTTVERGAQPLSQSSGEMIKSAIKKMRLRISIARQMTDKEFHCKGEENFSEFVYRLPVISFFLFFVPSFTYVVVKCPYMVKE